MRAAILEKTGETPAVAAGRIGFEVEAYALEDVDGARQHQRGSPHAKPVVHP